MILGVVSYLNARPFSYGLRAEAPEVQLLEEIPSRLVGRLLGTEVEAAILPSIECFRPYLTIVPGTCIASRGPALSARLFPRKPIGQIETVAVDIGSRATAALARVLLARRYGLNPIFRRMAPDLDTMLERADAAVLIGDAAMAARGRGESLDLGEEWFRLTGLPFVFALWAAHPGADIARLSELLPRAIARGLSMVDEIADRESTRLGLPRDECHDYLLHNMTYELNDEAVAGLEEFRRLAVRCGLLDNDQTLNLAR